MSTIGENDRRIQYTTAGGESSFSYDFQIDDADHVEVYRDGVLQTRGTHYSVTGVGDTDGGDIVPDGSLTIAADEVWTIEGDTPEDRSNDYSGFTTVKPATVDADLDRMIFMAQQFRRDINRSIRIGIEDATDEEALRLPGSAGRASKAIGFDENGDIVVFSEFPAGSTPGSISENVNDTDLIEWDASAQKFVPRATGTANNDVPRNSDIDSRGFAQQVDSVSALRSGSYPASLDRIWLSGYHGVGTAGGGPLYRDSADTTTADNGGTVFVDADGVRWKRPDVSTLTPEWFGAKGDGATDDSTAFINMMNAHPDAEGFRVRLDAKTYKIDSTPLYLTRRIEMIGVAERKTVLDFSDCTDVVNAPYNCHIITVHSNNVTGQSSFSDSIDLPSGWVGDHGQGCEISALSVLCNGAVSDGNGVWFNINSRSRDLRVDGANLHNILIVATANSLETRGGAAGSSGLDIGGNSNNGVYTNLWSRNAVNGDGIMLEGSDANANVLTHPDTASNKGWGINDKSLLGNTIVGPHTAGNSYGAYRVSNPNARTTLIAPYVEGGQGADNSDIDFDINDRSIILGGLEDPPGNTRYIGGSTQGIRAGTTFYVSDDDASSAGNSPDPSIGVLDKGRLTIRSSDGLPVTIERSNSDYSAIRHNGDSFILLRNTALGEIKPDRPYFPNGLALAQNHSQTTGTSAPTSGTWSRGAVVWNTEPSAGGNVGWVCVTGGTPGTWKTFGDISA